MRIDKFLTMEGYGSRKDIKRLLAMKAVTINHQLVSTDSVDVDPMVQDVRVRGVKLENHPHVYYMIHKPKGIVSAVTDSAHQTVLDLIKERDRYPNLAHVGRLDRDTEGLMILTDNGKLLHYLAHPAYHINKVYLAEVNGPLSQGDVDSFEKGIVFHGGILCESAKLEILNSSQTTSLARLTISEGKFHQVKKMFLSVGKKVTYLKRIAIGSLVLDEQLGIGEYRTLTIKEGQNLFADIHIKNN